MRGAPQREKYTLEELNNLAEIRIYAAENNELLKTISDEEQLYQYNQGSAFDDSDIAERQGELKKDLEGAKEQYYQNDGGRRKYQRIFYSRGIFSFLL